MVESLFGLLSLSLVVGILVGLFAGLNVLEFRDQIDDYLSKKRPIIKLKRYQLGNTEFNVTSFKVKNRTKDQDGLSPESQDEHLAERKALEQIIHFEKIAKDTVSLVIAYDLKWFEEGKLDDDIQTEIDAIVKNIERYNRFLNQSELIVTTNIEEAATELKTANQPILNRLGTIRKTVIKYIEDGGYKLIEFNQR